MRALLREAISTGRRKLARLDPKIVMLSGPLSMEDQAYFSSAPIDSLSHSTIPSALQRLGVSRVDVADLTTDEKWLNKAKGADLVVTNLHGSPGEDGTIQGVLEANGLTYLGADLEASVAALNKHFAKLIVSAAGVPTPDWSAMVEGRVVGGKELTDETKRYIDKPLHGGSSINMRMAKASTPLPKSGKWIRETFHEGRDLTVTVIEIEGKPIALPPVIIKHKGEYYSEEIKFGDQWNHGVVAEQLDPLDKVYSDCKMMAVKSHNAIGARHISRSDFVVPADREGPFFLELNTIPGLSKVSNVAECGYAAEMTYDDLIALILSAALKTKEM